MPSDGVPISGVEDEPLVEMMLQIMQGLSGVSG
jgi:hypothetical protein